MTPTTILRAAIALCFLFTAVFVVLAQEEKADRWEPAIRKFEMADAKDPPEPAGVLFIGSSTIRGWDLNKSFPELGALNRGFGGSRMSDVLRYVDRIVIPYRPRVIFLYEGDNDISGGVSPKQVAGEFQEFAHRVHLALPKTRIVFLSIKPSLARWDKYDRMKDANRQIEAITQRDDRLEFVDVSRVMLDDSGTPRKELLAGDGLHLSAQGYEQWTNLVRPLVK